MTVVRRWDWIVTIVWRCACKKEQYVQHALMENECTGCLTDVITSFKSFNPTWEQIRIIIVSKDYGEISLLRGAFPGVRILLCTFHVVKYLRTEVSK